MKTQILQLAAHDDLTSARDKIGWGQTGRIVLVWPENTKVLHRRLDLALLKRYSERIGAQLALVSHDPEVLFHARQLRIPVFSSTGQAHSKSWGIANQLSNVNRARPSFRPDLISLREELRPIQRAWLQNTPGRLGFFSMGVLAVFSLLAILFPQAQVNLVPQEAIQETNLAIVASSDFERVHLSGEIPARGVSIVVEEQDNLIPSGKVSVPENRAYGRVRFTNLTEKAVTIPAGTVVRTLDEEAVRFATTARGDMPSGFGRLLSLTVQALEAGQQGNMPPGSLVAIEGPVGLQVAVTNPLETQGGSDRLYPGATAEDRQRLFDQVLEKTASAARRQLLADQPPGNKPIPASLSLSRVLDHRYTPEIPSGIQQNLPIATGHLELTMRVEYRALIVAEKDLETVVNAVLDSYLPPGFFVEDASLKIEHLSEPSMQNEVQASWRLLVRRTLFASISPQQVIGLSLGKTPAQASQHLAANLPLAEPPEVLSSPAWWPRLPFLPFRISVNTFVNQN